jgi:signal recognition particle subunit SRP19
LEENGLRKQSKTIIWPAYFDSGKSRMEGRRVNKNLAVPAPKITEIQEAAVKLNLENELVPEKGYPKNPWSKPGMLLVEKQGSKEQVINKIAKQLLKIRNEVPKTESKK